MSQKWSAYRARWQGMEYACAPEVLSDGLRVHLFSPRPLDGFEEITSERYVRLVTAAECQFLAYVTMICRWRDEPFIVRDERPGDLLIEYTGGKVPRALELGLERIERGVYRGWVPRHEVRGLRETTTPLLPSSH